jgi:beta-mannanase
MDRTKILLLPFLLAACLMLPSFGASKLIDLNTDGCYIGAYVSWKTVDDGNEWNTTAADIKGYEQIIGRKLAIISSYIAFSYDGKPYYFPSELYDTAKENGSVLLLSWEPRDWDTSSPMYFEKSMLPDIISGKYDKYIDQWAQDIKSLDQPVLLRFAPEMNVQSFSWSGVKNGGGNTVSGSAERTEGPETYVEAYRHIHDRFKSAGVDNVLWVWTPILWGLPFEPWNHYTNYYPGNDYVDIIAMDEYNWGTSQNWSQWKTFNEMYWQLYSELTHLYPDKALMIGEFSSSEKGGNKAQWIKETFRDIKEKYPRIKAFVWFQTDNRNETVNNMLENSDWRINSSSDCVDPAREALSDKYFLDRPVLRSPDQNL